MPTTLQSHAMRSGRIIAMLVVLLGVCAGSMLAQEKVTPWNGWKLKQWYKEKGITPPAAPASVAPSVVTPASVLAPPDQADVHVYTSGNPQTENSIAVNQVNPEQLMISTNGAATSTGQTWFFSTNGGATWFGSETSPNGVANYGDPVALFNYAGNTAFWGTLRDPGGIGIMSTTNFGTTWSAMTDADLTSSANDDKEHIMTDLSGVYPNNIYAAWTDFTPSPAIVKISRSTNAGATWQAATSMSIGSDFGQGVNVATGPDGEVYVAFANYIGGNLPEAGVRVTKSTDGGVTWSAANVAFTMQGIRTTSGPIAAFGNTRVNSFPSMGVDRSNGPHRGWVYITYSDASSGDADIYMRYSSDGGTSWSGAIQVNADYGNQEWFSSVAVDALTGDVSIGYYSQDTVGAPLLTARYVAHTNDAGSTWERTRVSDVRFTPAQLGGSFASGYCGDYYETAAYGTKAWALWSDNRSGTFNAYVSKLQYAERFGFVKGTVTTGGSPLSGVAIDFVGATNQQGATSAGDGTYKAGVKVDTPGVVQTHTIRGQKFGYITTTDTVSVVMGDTVTRNLSMALAPSGAIAGRVFNSDSASVKALIQVRFNGTLVVDNLYSDSLTGLYSVVLPNGSYDVKVDPPSPYGTMNYSPVTISNDTPFINSMVRWVIEPSPLVLTDTLGVGQSNTKNLLLTNTTADSVPYRLSNDQAAFLVAKQQVFAKNSPLQDPNVTFGKGEVDPRFGPSGITGSGGPDAFGYVWLDSDGGGATYNWVDISSVGTSVSWSTGDGDEGHAVVALPFSFPFYGTTYSSVKITSNGWVSFDVASTNHSLSNTTIPAAAEPNLAAFGFWDDLDQTAGGNVYYYNDVANSQFIVQYNNVPHYSNGGVYTFEIILKGNGDIVYQYQNMTGAVNSASIGIENAGGTVGLQTAFNATYAHNSLAVLYKVRGVDWLTHTPGYGVLPPSGTVNITNTFDAAGLIPGTTYSADVFVDATHPDVQGSLVVPAHLRVEPLVGPGIAVTPVTKSYGNVIIGQSKVDSVKIRNIGTSTLVVSEISSTNAEFAVTPSSGSVAPDDSLKVYITFSPLMPAGAKAATIHILSNDPINDTVDVSVSGTAVGVPQFLTSVDSLTKNLEGGTMDSIQFTVRNEGTLSGDFAARAVMYPHTLAAASSNPVIFPVKLSSPLAPTAGSILLVSDNPGLALTSEKGSDPAPAPYDVLGSSSSLIYRALVAGGFTVDTVSFSTHNPATYSSYALVIWSAGQNTATMFSDATKRTALVNYVNSGGRVWVEGGEVGFVYRKSGTTTDLDPVFRRTVLRDSVWLTDATTSGLTIYATGSPVFTTPNLLTSPITFTGTGWGVRDGVRLQPADAGTEKLAGWSVWTSQGPDSANMITHTGGSPQTMFTSFAFSGITDTSVARKLAQNIATYMAGGGGATANWLFIRPTSGTIATADSIPMYARFEATDPSVFNNPGEYLGRIEVAATNSALADTLKIPARMFVIPPAGARMFVDSSSLHFGSVALSTTKDKTVLVKNIGGAPLTVTGIGITDPRFIAAPTSFTLNSLDTQRVTVSFTPPLALPYSGTMSFTSNDASAPVVALSGNGIGVAAIAVDPDSFYFNMPSGPDTNSQALKIRNPGTDTLRYTIDEVGAAALVAAPAAILEPAIELPKGVEDVRKGAPVLLGTGGPDAFGYRWIDSDEPGGPVYSWVDVASVGTAVTWSSGDGDEGHAIVALPFSFPFYGSAYNSVKITSNGWVSFDVVSTNHTYSNTTIPNSADPNLAVYGFWDDLDQTVGGNVYYYHDVANSQFIVQYDNVPHYSTGGPYTFEIILKASGEIVCQYNTITSPDNSASIGIENATGTVGLQTVSNATYVHNSLAVMYTSDLYPWMSTSVTSGTIAPGDSQTVQVKAHPGLIPNATYNGKFRIMGNTPDTAKVPVRLDVVGGTPYVTLTYPNGGETFVVGQSYNITWTKNIVDSVKIEYSTNAGSSWIVIKASTPAGTEDLYVHPKMRGKEVASSTMQIMSSYLWTVPATATTQALVRVSDAANASVSDVSNSVFTITSTPPAVWTSQTSGTTSALYSVSIVNDQVAWAVGVGGVARLTVDGGTTWTTIGTLPADAHMVFAVDATTALAVVNPSAGNDARIYRTTNGGTGWSLVYQNTTTGAFMDAVHMFDASNGIAIGDPVSAQWLMLRTTDGGATWAPSGTLAQAGTEAGWNNSFVWTDNNHGWFGTSNSRIYYTTDGGTNWAYGTTPAANSYGVAMLSSTLGLAGAATGGTAKTADGGATWTAGSTAGTGTVFPAGVSIPTNRFWATSGTTIYKTTDDGTTWTVDHSRAAAFDHIAMKVVPSANVIVGYAVGESGQISKYTEYLPIDNEPASISGVKFVDVDGDSVKDAGEPGLAGWMIYLAGTATDSAVTDANGYYMFDSLATGAYTVTEASSAGWIQTVPATGAYAITLASGDSITGTNFGNFRLGSINGMKWKDTNGNGVKDGGEPGLAGWQIQAARLNGAPLSTTTNGAGQYSFAGLMADSYTISEIQQSGYTQTYPSTPGTHAVLMVSGLDTVNVDFGNFYPDTAQYRTFAAESLALGKDIKGKVGKYNKRKANKVEFLFSLTVPVGPLTNVLNLEFSMIVNGKITNSTGDSIAAFTGKKPAPLTLPVISGQQIWVQGWGVSGKQVKVKYAFGSAKKVVLTAFTLNQPRLPMPNTYNLLNELYLQNAFAADGGLVVGVPLTGIDLIRYGWVRMAKFSDVQKSLYQKGVIHTGTPRNFDLLGTKPFIKMQKNLQPSKHNNALFGELVALGVNIAASAAEKTPIGFGELIYNDGSGGPLSGRTVAEIDSLANYFITYNSTSTGLTADSLYRVVRKLNLAFSGEMDTVSFASALVLNGVRPVSDVSYLQPNFSAQPKTLALSPLNLTEMPSTFALSQNYPNPFNPTTSIDFMLPADGFVTMKVYDILGREVATILNREMMDEGEHTVDFAANELASGVYFYRLIVDVPMDDAEFDQEASSQMETYQSFKKFILMK